MIVLNCCSEKTSQQQNICNSIKSKTNFKNKWTKYIWKDFFLKTILSRVRRRKNVVRKKSECKRNEISIQYLGFKAEFVHFIVQWIISWFYFCQVQHKPTEKKRNKDDTKRRRRKRERKNNKLSTEFAFQLFVIIIITTNIKICQSFSIRWFLVLVRSIVKLRYRLDSFTLCASC